MSKKGGYLIIDLHGYNCDITQSDPIEINGIHEKVEGNYDKPILLSGMLKGKVELPDIWLPIPNIDNEVYKYRVILGETQYLDIIIKAPDDEISFTLTTI